MIKNTHLIFDRAIWKIKGCIVQLQHLKKKVRFSTVRPFCLSKNEVKKAKKITPIRYAILSKFPYIFITDFCTHYKSNDSGSKRENKNYVIVSQKFFSFFSSVQIQITLFTYIQGIDLRFSIGWKEGIPMGSNFLSISDHAQGLFFFFFFLVFTHNVIKPQKGNSTTAEQY